MLVCCTLVRLEPHICEWLRENLQVVVSDDDLATTYDFAHAFNAHRELAKQQTSSVGDENLLWQIEFFDANGAKPLEAPLARRIFAAVKLYSVRAKGVVALNAHLALRAGNEKQGFGRVIYAREDELYRRWGVREIHLKALGDGPIVWIKKFNFVPQRPQFLAEEYRAWAPRNGYSATPPTDPINYPDAFLSHHEGLMLYKVLR